MQHPASLTQGTLVTIGFFDGVHLGHRYLLERALELSSHRGLRPMAVTFNRPARCLLDASFHPSMMLLPEEKKQLVLSIEGLDCEVMDFTESILEMSAESFMDYLVKTYQMKALLVGYDHHFGKGRKDSFEDYQRYGQKLGVEVIRADAYQQELSGQPVSSSLIRTQIQQSDIQSANQLLGYSYFFSGKVTSGDHLGRSMGYATANLEVPEEKLLPGSGVYACYVLVGDQKYQGMLYVGTRPTIQSSGQARVEVHILDFSSDVYAERLTVYLEAFVRKERRFASLDELKEQIQTDEQTIRSLLSQSNSICQDR